MRKIFVIFAIVLLGGSLNARPSVDNEDDFSVDMWSNGNHLRYVRSTDAAEATSGTVVTVEKVDEAAAAAETTGAKTETAVEQKEPLKLDEAMKLVSTTLEKIHAENSITTNEAAAAPATTHEATLTAKEWKSEKKEDVESSSSSSSVVSTPLRTFSSNEDIMQSSYSRRYVNPYGDVLDRISEKTHPLKHKMQEYQYEEHEQQPSHFFKKQQQVDQQFEEQQQQYEERPNYGRVRTLASQQKEKPSSSVSVSRITVNGREVDPETFGNNNNNNNNMQRTNPYATKSRLNAAAQAGEMASLLRQRGAGATGFGQTFNMRNPSQWQGGSPVVHWAPPTNKWAGIRNLNFSPNQQPIYYGF